MSYSVQLSAGGCSATLLKTCARSQKLSWGCLENFQGTYSTQYLQYFSSCNEEKKVLIKGNHFGKVFRIRSFSRPYFPSFGLRYSMSLRLWFKWGKIWTKKTPNMATFYVVNDIIDNYPIITLISKIVYIIPVSNAWPEGGGSADKIIKIKNRSTLKSYSLCAQLMISMNDQKSEALEASKMIKQGVKTYGAVRRYPWKHLWS